MINRTLAERYWPDEDPLGRQFSTGGMDSHFARWATVIGVVGNVRHYTLTGEPRAEYYVYYRQRPDRVQNGVAVVRTDGDPAALTASVRRVVRETDPDVPAEFATMEGWMSRSVADRRFSMLVLGAFAAVALVLAAVGIYGVVSYSVARRNREIGIRMALGAEPGAVRWMVMGEALKIVGIGLGLGVVAALLVSRVLRNLLYEISPTDPLTFAGVVLVLAGAAALASWIPARRTTAIDPMITMRAE